MPQSIDPSLHTHIKQKLYHYNHISYSSFASLTFFAWSSTWTWTAGAVRSALAVLTAVAFAAEQYRSEEQHEKDGRARRVVMNPRASKCQTRTARVAIDWCWYMHQSLWNDTKMELFEWVYTIELYRGVIEKD